MIGLRVVLLSFFFCEKIFFIFFGEGVLPGVYIYRKEIFLVYVNSTLLLSLSPQIDKDVNGDAHMR